MKALVVEDDPMTLRLLVRVLSRFFPRGVLQAHDGAEALKLLAAERPGIVFCDVEMPTLDGVVFVRQIRARPDVATLPVIMLTAARDHHTVRALVDLGVVDYILKPVDLPRTVRRLERRLPVLLPQMAKGSPTL